MGRWLGFSKEAICFSFFHTHSWGISTFLQKEIWEKADGGDGETRDKKKERIPQRDVRLVNWLVSQPDRLAGLIWETSLSLPLFIFFLLPFPHSFLIKHIHNISFKQEVNVSLACKHRDIDTQTQFLKTDRTKSLGSLHAPRRREMKTKTIRKKREGERESGMSVKKREMERWRGRKWEQPLSSKMSQQPFYQIQTKGNTWLALDQQREWVCVRSYGSIYVQAFQICPYEYKHVYNGCCVDVYSKESCLCFRP